MTVLQDLRHGARLLVRAPGFAAVAIAALAIGIGANTAIFSVVNTLLLQPLPYHDADRLAIVWEHNIPRDRKNNVVAPANFLHWREMNQGFADLGAFSFSFSTTLTGAGDPEELQTQLVTAEAFPVLGVQPALGRGFTPEEISPNSRVIVISDRLWKRRFGGDRAILQRPIVAGGTPYSVIGVMPPGFSFLDKNVDVWLPFGFTAQTRTPRGRSIQVVGRLKPGVTVARAHEDMTRVAAELVRKFPEFNTGWTARVVPLREQLTGTVRPALLVLAGAVAFVLLIACANVANLLLARATVRQRELAVRAALGAGRARLFRQLLAESLVLSVAGGVGGLLLAWWGLHFLRAVAAERLPIQRLELVGIDGWVLAFTLGASLLCGLVFGAVPALTAAGIRPERLAQGRRPHGIRVARESHAERVRHHRNRPRARASGRRRPPDAELQASARRRSRFRPFAHRDDAAVASGRAVWRRRAACAVLHPVFSASRRAPGSPFSRFDQLAPADGSRSGDVIRNRRPAEAAAGYGPVADVRVISHDYLKAMGVPLLRGRLFNEQDAADAKGRVVINENMARRFWPGEDAIGKHIRINWDTLEDEVIGVVGDVKHAGLDGEVRSMTYWPFSRNPYGSMTIAVRTAGEASGVVNAITGIVRQMDPDLVVANVRTMEEVVSDSVAERRLTMMLLAVFAGAALLLAAVGIYGVIAYSVTQRTQEIGIRMALGAQRGDVLRMIVGQAMALTAAGIVSGAFGAILLTRVMTGLLFNVKPGDPLTFSAVAVVLALVAASASYIPGRRATRVDPVIALRAE